MNCTLCNTRLNNKADEYYFICGVCGAYVKDKKHYVSEEKEKYRYEEHNNDVDDVRYRKFTSPITQTIINNFNSGDTGLDYGSGTGPVISKVLREKGYNVRLYDPFFHPDEDYLKYQYDYIFSCEVFEHFHRPENEIEKLLGLLKTDGFLIIMTHLYTGERDFNTWYYRNDPTHVFIYTEQTISYIAEKYNLELLEKDERLVVFKKRR